MNRSLIASLVVVAAGCGGGGFALEGMYTIDAWNENTTSCADPGPSVLGDPTHPETVFYLKIENFFGEFLNAKACIDLAECQAEAADDTVDIGAFSTFEDGNDEDGWTTRLAFGVPDFAEPTMCRGVLTVGTLTADGESAVSMRFERSEVLYPMSAGECPDAEAEAAVAGAPCSSLQVVHGAQIGDL